MTTRPYMQNCSSRNASRPIDEHHHKLSWELMGATALCSITKRAQHGHPETEMEDT